MDVSGAEGGCSVCADTRGLTRLLAVLLAAALLYALWLRGRLWMVDPLPRFHDAAYPGAAEAAVIAACGAPSQVVRADDPPVEPVLNGGWEPRPEVPTTGHVLVYAARGYRFLVYIDGTGRVDALVRQRS